MTRKIGLALLAAGMLSLVGCAHPPTPILGLVMLDIKAPLHVDDDGRVGPKTGKACVKSVLGWLTKGDASLEAAAKNGGIKKIDSVDFQSSGVLGVIGEFCVIAHGT